VFDLVNGIPLHPLVVHAIVVLLPLATLGTIAIAVRPPWRARFGPLVVLAAFIATVLCPVATSSGEALEKRVGDPGEHAHLGDQLIWFAIPLVVLSLALVLLDRRQHRTDAGPAVGTEADGGPDATMTATRTSTSTRGSTTTLVNVVAVLAVLAGLASAVQVYRVGDSGARAAWGDVPAPRSAGQGGD
jgi:uncharacterized membrane protein